MAKYALNVPEAAMDSGKVQKLAELLNKFKESGDRTLIFSQFTQVMDILEDEKIFVTFFVVAGGLRDESTNFSSVYREMRRRGHQIALHSDSHPK